MQTRLCKEDQEPMLKQEFSFEDTLMYQDEEDYRTFVKVENEEYIKEMLVSESRPQAPPIPRQRWRDNAVVTIERQPEYDRVFQAKHTGEAGVIIDPYNPQHYCAMCEKTFSHQAKFRRHVRMSHSLYVKYFKYPHATIDPNNPQNYCAKCGRSYPDSYFHVHLRKQHGLHVKKPKSTDATSKPYARQNHRGSQKKRNAKYFAHPYAIINPNHPQNYCSKCGKTYHKQYFRKHLRIIHGLQDKDFKPRLATSKPRVPRNHHDSQNDSMAKRSKHPQADTNLLKPLQYCAECDHTYPTISSFRVHLKRAHSIKTPLVKYPNAEIDIFHLDNYCAKCDKKYEGARLFLNHLQDSHMSTLYNIRSSVDVSKKRDPAYYCPKCDRYYTEEIFKQHFTKHRRMSKFVNINPDAEIDLNSPDFYCSKCERHFSNQPTFGRHVTFEHGLGHEWNLAKKQRQIKFPNAQIDFFNPHGYCAKCDKKLLGRDGLWAHTVTVHALYPPSVGGKSLKLGACNLRNGKELTPLFR
ncbi:uncharacterized protein ATC70_002633 [Mucor velutinosus]|uniref:C2H2-type domain-containing protein n=1 Tax=Mucor velutinosus TaxID=708070 RepID=A0AAN7DEE5_9FUNG|nr:hypothetical protein ATC70_002633 [Mucor velutinosus]